MPTRTLRTLTPLALVCAVAGCAAQSSKPAAAGAARPWPIRVQEIAREIDGQPLHGWAAWVDLDDPRVEIRVTSAAPHEPNDPPRMEVRGETTLHWFEREHLTLAINAHFFAKVADPNRPYEPNLPYDLVGPCISAGHVVSSSPAGETSPVLGFTAARRGRVGLLHGDELGGFQNLVSGVPDSEQKPSSLLVEKGRNTGATARVEPEKRHPRTAAGLSADGRTLIVVVVDGRQPTWSIGLTLPELADLLIELGAADAVALDGGGSTSFVYAPPDGPRITNKPSGNAWRAVGASLGVVVRPAGGAAHLN